MHEASARPADFAVSDGSAPARLRECHDCGQFQIVPPMPPGTRAQCLRCDASLRHTRHDPLGIPLALTITSIVLFLVGSGMTMLSISTAGQHHLANLFTGPEGLEKQGMWELSAVVLFTTFAAPAAKLGCMLYVLLGLRLEQPPRHIRMVFGWVERLRPWSMIEVYLLGVFVAYVKLGSLAQIDIGVALYALGALILTMIAADVMLDDQYVWEEMERRGVRDAVVDHAAVARQRASVAVGCHVCGLASQQAGEHPRCPRCGFALHRRKPDSIARTWALGVAAAVLYIPANIYPVMTIVQLGAPQPSTILGGVRELLVAGEWPLAALVFFASVMVPMLKLVGLTILLTTTQRGSRWRLRDRTVLYRIVDAIGRWSMIDIFMESILVALVQFGSIITIDPGVGAIAFCGVVILTMLAAESFDPRLMWDAAAERAA